jgi:hypothetical protein
LGKARQYIVLFGSPFLIAFGLVLLVRLIWWTDMPEWLFVPAALVLAPTTWAGVVLFQCLMRYQRAINGAVDADTSLVALQRLASSYRFREWLSRGPLKRGVYVGYLFARMATQIKVGSHPLNGYNYHGEEAKQERINRQAERFRLICEFAFSSGTLPRDDPKILDTLARFAKVSENDVSQNRTSAIIRATLADGPGFLSALTAMTYAHFISGLPEDLRREVFTTLRLLTFDPYQYGWLSVRVLEATIYMCVTTWLPAQSVALRIQPILTTATEQLLATSDGDEATRTKWQTRAILRQAVGLKEVA